MRLTNERTATVTATALSRSVTSEGRGATATDAAKGGDHVADVGGLGEACEQAGPVGLDLNTSSIDYGLDLVRLEEKARTIEKDEDGEEASGE